MTPPRTSVPWDEIFAGCPGELAAALTYLSQAGCPPTQAIKIIHDKLGLGVGDAKAALLDSPAWRDVADAQERMWRELDAEEGQG